MVDITNLTSATSASDLVSYANEASQGYFALGLIVAFFFVLLLVSKRFEFSNALMVSSFLSFAVSAVMAYAGWIPLLIVIAFLTLTALTYLYKTVAES